MKKKKDTSFAFDGAYVQCFNAKPRIKECQNVDNITCTYVMKN
jgi:hypothetical protein